MQSGNAWAEARTDVGAVPTPEELVKTYAPLVYRFCMMLCGNRADADDLAQEALLRAMRRVHRFDPRRGSMEAWLWQIALSTARDARRAARRVEALWERILAGAASGAASPSAELIALDHLRDAEVLAALRTLSRRHRTLIALRFGAQLSYSEIAALTSENEQTVKQAIYRALAALRSRLEVAQR
jgi:RNA polymerase sigma factor (sigma-70 family)